MTSTDVAERPIADVVDDVVARGDLSKLTAEQRVVHYHNVCNSMGLNPATQPFMYITLNGKLQLYARKDATDQLRKINNISIQIIDYTAQDGLLTVHGRATDKSGRSDEDYGVVPITGLRGEALSNAFMKAVTKMKRRLTLSISGLGYSDESEIEEEPSFTHVSRSNLPKPKINPPLTEEGKLGSSAPDEQERVPTPFPSQAERGATAPCALPVVDENDIEAWRAWIGQLMAYVRAAPDPDTINDWTTANAELIAKLKAFSTPAYAKLMDMVTAQLAARNEESS